MFENVLVGVDGGRGGRDAIALATRLAGPDAELTLAHVHAGRLRPSHAISPGLVAGERDASRALLERERETAGVKAELVGIEALSAGGGLHEQADRQRADLLVVGSCGRGRLGRALLGDDTRAALNGARCAVAVAARGYCEHAKPLASVGVAYNGTPESEAALTAARRLAEPTKAVVHAMTVVAMPAYAYGYSPLPGEGLDAMIDEADARLRKLDGVRGSAVSGLTGEELADFGDHLDLLVVGSRGYGPVKRLVLGSTSDYLERHAHCSLLVLPRPAAPDTDAEHAAETSIASTV